MKTGLEREFIHRGRRREALFQDELIALVPREYAASARQLGGAKSFVLDIVERATGDVAGEIALRVGDSESLFYLGHIGYHVDPPYRGRGMAYHACVLCAPIFTSLHMRTVVITTDVDNLPSARTCERLRCELECTVAVPKWCRDEFGISAVKRRYIYTLPC